MTTIWNAATAGTLSGSERVPVDTSSTSSPTRTTVADICTYVTGQSTGITFPLATDKGGLGTVLADPNADRILFWDDSAGSYAYITTLIGLSLTGTTLEVTAALPAQTGKNGQYLTTDGTTAAWNPLSGGGDTLSSATSTDNTLARYNGTNSKTIKGSGVLVDDSNNMTGLGTVGSGAHVITSSSATAFAVGPNGSTNAGIAVDASTASAVTGIQIDMKATGSGVDLKAIGTGASENLFISSKSSGSVTIRSGTANRLSISTSAAVFTPTTSSTATIVPFSFTAPASTAMTAGADHSIVLFDNAATFQHASNTTVENDYGVRITAPTIGFATAGGTVTTASSLFVSGAPIAGTNATLTNSYALNVAAGDSYFAGKIIQNSTITAGGTTGAQTINKPSGTVNFAAAQTSLVVTNSLVTANSIVHAVVRTNDTTSYIKNVVPSSGSFTINLGAAATSETSVGFVVFN